MERSYLTRHLVPEAPFYKKPLMRFNSGGAVMYKPWLSKTLRSRTRAINTIWPSVVTIHKGHNVGMSVSPIYTDFSALERRLLSKGAYFPNPILTDFITPTKFITQDELAASRTGEDLYRLMTDALEKQKRRVEETFGADLTNFGKTITGRKK